MEDNAPALAGPGSAMITRALGRAWSLPPRRNRVAVTRNLSVPMSDGTTLQADHYFPVTDRQVATVLVRTPYGRGMPFSLDVRFLAERGFEGWLEHPDVTDPFWAPLQCGAALDRTTVPTLLVGGWQDLFLAQTLEQYRVLSGRGVPTRLLVGPWTHLDVGTRAGAAIAESLAWLDRYLGPGAQAAEGPGDPPENSVRVWVGGTQAPGWREVSGWPPAGPREQRWYLGQHGTLSPRPAASPGRARFRYDPADPTPSVGGAVMTLTAGVRDNQAVEQRRDVLVFTSEPLAGPVEILGEVAAELRVARDNPHADLFVRLCDVDAQGRSRNVCDGIVRLTAKDPDDGLVRVSLIGVARQFAAGHRIRLQVAGGAHPRFARNPGTGQVEAPAWDAVPTRYEIDLAASALLLPVTP